MWVMNDADVTIRLRSLHDSDVTVWEVDGSDPSRGGIVEGTAAGYNRMQQLAKKIAVKHCDWKPLNPWVRGRMDGDDWLIELGDMEEVTCDT